MRAFSRISCMIAAVVVLAMAAGCRDSEQNRPLTYEKGTPFQPDGRSFSFEERETLRHRHRQQFGLD